MKIGFSRGLECAYQYFITFYCFQSIQHFYYCSIMYIINIIMYHNVLITTYNFNTTTNEAKSPEIKESMSSFCLLVGCSLLFCYVFKNSQLIVEGE